MNLWIRRAARILRLYVIILSVFSTQIYPLTILNAAPMLQGGVPTYCTDMNALETRLNQGGTVLFNACPNGVVIFTRRIIVNASGIDLTIDGGGGGMVDFSGTNNNNTSPILAFDSNNGTLTVQNIRFKNSRNIINGAAIDQFGPALNIGATPRQVTLRKTQFTNNVAYGAATVPRTAKGGAIYNASNLTIIDSVFSDNRVVGGAAGQNVYDAEGYGGALYHANPQKQLTILGTTFNSNLVQPSNLVNIASGGAIYISENGATGQASIQIGENSRFYGNQALTGGAIWSGASLGIAASQFENNVATVPTGTIQNQPYGGGAIYLGSDLAEGAKISDSIIRGNRVDFNAPVGSQQLELVSGGGGVFVHARTVLNVSRSEISYNTTASWTGGGIFVNSSGSLISTNNTIAYNRVDSGNTFSPTPPVSYFPLGGGVYSKGSFSLLGNTIAYNGGYYGGGLGYVQVQGQLTGRSLNNTVFYQNGNNGIEHCVCVQRVKRVRS